MNISAAIDSITRLQIVLPSLLINTEIAYVFGENRPCVGDDSNEKFRGCLGGSEIGAQSGIYIFTSELGEILYIGKATKNNLHQRVWDHLGTPARLESGWMTFPRTEFQSAQYPEQSQIVVEGKSRLHVFSVSDPDTASLVEVYLQLAYLNCTGRLPVFNKQVG